MIDAAQGVAGAVNSGPDAKRAHNEHTEFLVLDGLERVTRWAPGAEKGDIVAQPYEDDHWSGWMAMAVDVDGALLVVDEDNSRVTRWVRGAIESVVAGGNGKGPSLQQFDVPYAVAVDIDGALLVADYGNHRVMR